MNDDAADILAYAAEWARAGGRVARRRFGSATASRKHDRTLVTDAEHAVQALLLDAIVKRFPSHAVLTEETMRRPERHAAIEAAEGCWSIDPIDGTRNYWRGVPSFAVSVGVLRSGTPIVGAVYAVMTDQMFTAYAGGGARCDKVRLQVADGPPTHETLIGSPSGHGDPMPATIHEWLDRMTLRNLGATALHLALVAAGALDAAFCLECRLWDVAAGALLVLEAGGRFTDPNGREYFPMSRSQTAARDKMPFLAAGPNLHRHLLESWRRRA